MPVNKQKLIVILGPTASGKTVLSLKLAKKFKGYIISADSRQIYKEMDIGTAKPKTRIKNYELRIKGISDKIYTVNNIPYFMIDVVNLDQEFTLAYWQEQTFKIINYFYQLKAISYQLPFLVGGTGLYISSIVDNYNLAPGKINQTTRNILQATSLPTLLNQLKKLDLDTYKSIDKNNKRRVVRALEYVLTNNEFFYRNTKKSTSPYDVLQIGIKVPRVELHKCIDKRVDEMIKKGLINEVEKLVKKYSPDPQALSGIGYRQIIQYLNGKISKDETIELTKRDTRRYAKRQMTWFKRDKRIHWVSNYSQAEKLVNKFIKK